MHWTSFRTYLFPLGFQWFWFRNPSRVRVRSAYSRNPRTQRDGFSVSLAPLTTMSSNDQVGADKRAKLGRFRLQLVIKAKPFFFTRSQYQRPNALAIECEVSTYIFSCMQVMHMLMYVRRACTLVTLHLYLLHSMRVRGRGCEIVHVLSPFVYTRYV